MKLRMTVAAALLACLAATAVAQLSRQHTEFGQGPYQFLMTKEEAATWKTVTSDDAARAFVDLFWARRDPTPGTPANEFRSEIESRVQYADKHFTEGRTRGAMTDRGRILVLYGTPKRIERSGANQAPSMSEDGVADATAEQSSVTWIYEDANTRDVFGVQRAQVRFADRFGRNEFKLERSGLDLNAVRERAVARAITQPNLTAAPAATAAAPAPAAAQPAAPAAPAAVTTLTTDAFRTAVAGLKAATANPYAGKAYLTWGEYVTSAGETFVPVGLYVPKSAGISGDVTFFGVVEDAAGTSVLAFEQPATLAASKDDFFVDKSLSLPAGKHRGTFGLAQNGKVVALASTEMELAGNLDKDATAISQLILSNNIYPLQESQKADDPFAFGGVRVVPKADRTFRPSDELWYFFELRNPGLADPATSTGTVPVNAADAPARMPKVQVKLDVTGTTVDGKPVKMSAPLSEVAAIEMKGVPGHYGVGNAIPLKSFKPGEYSFSVKVIDTIKKTSYTLTDKFRVVE